MASFCSLLTRIHFLEYRVGYHESKFVEEGVIVCFGCALTSLVIDNLTILAHSTLPHLVDDLIQNMKIARPVAQLRFNGYMG